MQKSKKRGSAALVSFTCPARRIFFLTKEVWFLIIRVFKAHKSRSKMNTTIGMSFKKGSNDKDRKYRQEMRARKRELEATKLELANTQARAEAEKRELEFENTILDRMLDAEIARADAELMGHAQVVAHSQARAADEARKLAKAENELSLERACMEFLRKPREGEVLGNFVKMRIFDTYARFPAAQKRCILAFWEELDRLEKIKVVQFYRGERDIYSVFKCSMITVLDGPKWRDAMVNLVSTHPAFQCDGADWFKYDPANPTMCVHNMLRSARFNQRQFPLETTEGVPWNDPIWFRDFCYRWWVA
jgi:hypothetical protein